MFLLIVIKNYLSAAVLFIISLIPTLKPQSNGPLYSNVVGDWYAVPNVLFDVAL